MRFRKSPGRILLVTASLISFVLPVHCQEREPSSDSVTAALTILRFRKVDGPARLDTLESLLPQILKARLLRCRWLSISDAEADASSSGFSLRPSTTRTDNVPVFVLEGNFVALEDNIQVDLTLRSARDNSIVFRGSDSFDEETILDGADRLGRRVANVLAEKSGAGLSDRRIVLSIADFSNKLGSSSSPSVGILLSSSLLGQLSSAHLKNVSLRHLTGNDATDSKPKQREATVTGGYQITGDEVQVTARFEEPSGAHFLIETKGTLNSISQLNRQLSSGVLEVIRGRITPDASWKQSRISLVDASSAEFISEAKRDQEARDLFAAIVMYRKAIEKKSDDLDARYGLAGVYMTQGDFAGAALAYQGILQVNDKDVAALCDLGKAYLKAGDAPRAIEAVQKAQRIGTDDPKLNLQILQTLGDAEVLAGNYDNAIRLYLEGLEKPGAADSRELYHAISRAYRASGNTQRATEVLIKARTRFPDDPEFRSDLASIYVAQGNQDYSSGKYTEALAHFQGALDLHPADHSVEAEAYGYSGVIVGYFRPDRDVKRGIGLVKQSVELDPNKEWNRRFLGGLYLQDGKYQEAIDTLKQAIAIAPTANSYREIGQAYKLMKNYSAAIDSVQQALKLVPDYGYGYMELGEIYLASGDYARGTEDLKKAAQLQPSADIYSELATAYLDLKDYQKAFDAANEAVKTDKRSARAYETLGQVLTTKGEGGQFLQVLEKAVAEDPGFAWGFTRLGDLYRSRQKYDEAIKNLKRAVEIDTKDVWAREMLAETYFEKGDYDFAKSTIEQSIAISPDDWAYTYLAKVYRQKHDYRKALDCLKDALKINDQEPHVYEEFETVYKAMKQPDAFFGVLEQAQKDHPDFDWAYRKAGELYEDKGDYQSALDNLQKAHSIAPDNKDTRHDLATTYRKQGEQDRTNNNEETAIEEFQKSLDLEPAEQTFEDLAEVYQSRRDWPNMLVVAEKLRTAHPESTSGYVYMSSAYNSQKEYAKALDIAQQGLNILPNSAVLLSERGITHQLQRNYTAAIHDCQEASRLDPKYYYPYLVLARIELDQHQYAKAEGNARKVLEMGEDGYSELRDALMGLKRYQEAIQILKKALEKSPNDSELLASVAIVYHEGLYDDPSGYEQAYQFNAKAYRLDPKNLSIRENLAEASLTAGHYEEALGLANAVLTDHSLLSEEKLSMKLVAIASLICQRKDANAFAELSEFIRYYESIQQDYDRSWIFQGTRNFVEKNKNFSAAERDLLLKLINILEFPKDKADPELANLKNGLRALLREFQSLS